MSHPWEIVGKGPHFRSEIQQRTLPNGLIEVSTQWYNEAGQQTRTAKYYYWPAARGIMFHSEAEANTWLQQNRQWMKRRTQRRPY